MRAGQYAVVDGVEYRAKYLAGKDDIVLMIASGQEPPAGVVPERYFDGTLQATVPRSRASRLFEVETWALLHGRFPVQVHVVNPDGTVALEAPRVGFTPVGRPVRDEQNNVVVPPGLSGRPGELSFWGGVRPDELSDVQEMVREVRG
ncbi:hypothetical protein AA0Y32_03635 [Georgenia phoenicis]|uniref:hypothetical protein n=1 Tax=unclassified Georgenia TaxID=2626815 RepID=UPI0039B005A8